VVGELLRLFFCMTASRLTSVSFCPRVKEKTQVRIRAYSPKVDMVVLYLQEALFGKFDLCASNLP
jgi:hypothetical protein